MAFEPKTQAFTSSIATVTLGTGDKACKLGGVRDQASRRRRSGQAVFGEDALIRGAELHHKLLLFVVCHQCNVHVITPLQFHQRHRNAAQTARNAQAGFGCTAVRG